MGPKAHPEGMRTGFAIRVAGPPNRRIIPLSLSSLCPFSSSIEAPMLRTRPQSNKTTGLPIGVSRTWRSRKDRRPYLEYLVNWIDEVGKRRVKHFYVGVDPKQETEWKARRAAIAFRKAYEAQTG